MSSAASPKPPGLVFTFYSYKGGVGRSMAVANVGVVLAAEGHRVLLVDWDLEAPGLEVYFQRAANLVGDPAETGGILDLLEARARDEPASWQQCILQAEFFGHSLDLISAGRKTEHYRTRVQNLDWDNLFHEHRVGNYLNGLRDEWREAYDFVLIDSRTGVTDIGDICTVLLPDVLVLLFVSNHQSIDGVRSILERAVTARSKLPINRNKLVAVPVPARDERDREYDKSVEWQERYAECFGPLYREWLPKDVEPKDALNRIFIPYIARWSFGERIPVIESERERTDPTSLGAAYTRLATLISHRLDWYASEANASVAEVVNTRAELSKTRQAAREAEAALQQLKGETELRTKRFRKFGIVLGIVAAAVVLIGVAFLGIAMWRWLVPGTRVPSWLVGVITDVFLLGAIVIAALLADRDSARFSPSSEAPRRRGSDEIHRSA